MKSKQSIAEILQEFILRQFPLARQRKVDHDTSLLDSGIVDSLGTLEIVTFIESEFSITLTDEEMLAGYIAALQGPALNDPVAQKFVADSLRYTAHRKQHSQAERQP